MKSELDKLSYRFFYQSTHTCLFSSSVCGLLGQVGAGVELNGGGGGRSGILEVGLPMSPPIGLGAPGGPGCIICGLRCCNVTSYKIVQYLHILKHNTSVQV